MEAELNEETKFESHCLQAERDTIMVVRVTAVFLLFVLTWKKISSN